MDGMQCANIHGTNSAVINMVIHLLKKCEGLQWVSLVLNMENIMGARSTGLL